MNKPKGKIIRQYKEGYRKDDSVIVSVVETSKNSLALVVEGKGKTFSRFAPENLRPWTADGYADKIKTIWVAKGITEIGQYFAFGLENLEEVIFEDNSKLESLRLGAFQKCHKLKAIEFPKTFRKYGDNLFRGCTSIKTIRVPEGVTGLCCRTFALMSSLEEIYLPSTIKSVDLACFEKATALKNVYHNCTKEHWDNYAYVAPVMHKNDDFINANHIFLPSLELKQKDAKESYAKDALTAMYRRELINPESKKVFGAESIAKKAELLDILFTISGRDGVYGSAKAFAEAMKISDTKNGTLTKKFAKESIAKHIKYNGKTAAAKDVNAFFVGMGDKLTRADLAVAISKYLDTDLSKADRGPQQLEAFKKAFKAKGDGKVHILAPQLSESASDKKAGDCALILFPKGTLMLMDSGHVATQEVVIDLFDEIGIKDLDYLVISHFHGDHCGSVLPLAKHIYNNGHKIKHYWSSDSFRERFGQAIIDFMYEHNVDMTFWETDMLEKQEKPEDFVIAEIDGVKVQLFGPNQKDLRESWISADDPEVNSASLILRFMFGKSTFLFGGDCYIGKEAYLAHRYGSLLQSDFIKNNHHGNYQSNSNYWFDAVKPKYAVAEVNGNGNSKTVKILSKRGCVFYAVGCDGMIYTVIDRNKHYKITTQTDGILRFNEIIKTK